MSPDDYTDLENFVFQRMSDSGMVGLSVAIVKDGEVTYRRGFGFRDFVQGTSVTPDTTFCIGSVTKSFTALGILQLQEKGLLSVDDPVDRFLPFKAKPGGKKILIKHLLSHSSGLSHLGYAEATLSMATESTDRWFPIASPDDLLVFMNGASEWSLAKPGERHAYLNEGYILLGRVIEKASGKPYQEYIRDGVLKPLGMRKSTFSEEDVNRDPDVALPYITQNGNKVATRYPYGQMIADGGLMSNAMDMSRFLRMLLSGGELEGKRLASPETVSSMMEPHAPIKVDAVPGAGPRFYGYGLRIHQNFLGATLVHHSGSVFGSSAYISLLPERKTGIAILCSGGYFLEDMGQYALALTLGRDPYEIPYFRRSRILDDLTGVYKTFRDMSVYRVKQDGGMLEIESSWGTRTFTTPLVPDDIEGEVKRFRTIGVDSSTPVEFYRRDGGQWMIFERNLAKKTGDL